jgi:hypothetical protein
MSIDDFKYLYRFFFIGFLPGLLFFLGFEYLGSRIYHPGRFDLEEAFLKSFTICFAVAFWLRWIKRKRFRRHLHIEVPKININLGRMLTISLLFMVTNLVLFVFLQAMFNIIVYQSPKFDANFMLSVAINFFILSIFAIIHYFKTKRMYRVE